MHPTAIEAARYICRRLPGVPKTSFVKLLYLSDREYASRYGRPLLGTRWWREDQGPLSSAVTKMIAGPEFRKEQTKTSSGNPRVGHIEIADTPLTKLGSAELNVLDIVVAEFGGLGQVELLNRVHALPEVRSAKMKDEIELPRTAPRPGTDAYVSALTAEVKRETQAGIHDVGFTEDEAEAAERRAEARGGARAVQ